jgi:hypothetical protein
MGLSKQSGAKHTTLRMDLAKAPLERRRGGRARLIQNEWMSGHQIRRNQTCRAGITGLSRFIPAFVTGFWVKPALPAKVH